MIDAASVVGDANQHRGAIALRRQNQRRDARLPFLLPLGGSLDTVIERVAKEVQHGFTHLVQHGAIELDLAAFDLEVDLFAQGFGGIADDTRESLEHLPDGNHPAGHDLVLQIGQNLRGPQNGFCQLVVAKAFRHLCDAIASDHQLSDHVHQCVEPLGLDAYMTGCFLGWKRSRHVRRGRWHFLLTGSDGELRGEGLRDLLGARRLTNPSDDFGDIQLLGSRRGRQVHRLLQ